MRWNILIGGKAGQGVNELAKIIALSLINAGYYVFNYRDYPSLITGGHNFNVVCFSDKEIRSHDEDNITIFIAFDERSYEIHKVKIKEDTVIATNDKILDEKINKIFIDTKKYNRASNMVFAGFVLKILGLDKRFGLEEIEKSFKGKEIYEKNITAFLDGYNRNYNLKLSLEKNHNHLNKKELLTGSEAIVNGSIDAGIEIYFGYPMTPSTPVLTLLALKQKEKDIKVFSPENEIAVIHASLGASFAGRRVMIGTSGGGYDLMSEAISMAGCMELPLVVHLAQRTGPSTGVPTYTAQSDLNIALYSGHGEFNRIVIAPGDASEAYEKTMEAFYLAEKLNILVILLTDKHLVESGYTTRIDEPILKIQQRDIKLGKEIFKRNSYEHDDNWNTTEDYLTIKKSVDKRIAYKEKIYNACMKFKTYEKYGKGENLLLSFGSTKGAILDTLPNLENFRYIHVSYINPLSKEILEEIKNSKKVFVIECNATGQFSDHIQKNFGIVISQENRILRYDSLPFTPRYIIKEINKRL